VIKPDLIEPVAGAAPPPERRRQARYDWASHADGQWHQWREAPQGEDPRESMRAVNRLRLSAAAWAQRRGGWSESRWIDNGRQVWIAIHLPACHKGN
jgi:hypothetical protein